MCEGAQHWESCIAVSGLFQCIGESVLGAIFLIDNVFAGTPKNLIFIICIFFTTTLDAFV